MILGIIPARAGSKRVPQKNFKPFAGTTLTDLAIQQALDSKLLDKIVVNSDAEEVLKIASGYEGVTPMARPAAIAGDESPAIDYMHYTLDELEKAGESYDYVVIIQPSSPLRSGADIDNTVQMLLDKPESSSSVSVVQLAHMVHPYKIKEMEGDLLRPWLVDEGQKTAAHEIPDLFVRNCAVYVFKTENLRNNVTYGDSCLGYLMPPETSADINDPLDFEFAEFLYKKSIG